MADTSASADEYSTLCGICFTDISPKENPRGVINSCDHLFCSYCINEWAKHTNLCPMCKARFTRVTTTDAAGVESITKVRRRNYVNWEADDGDDEGDEEVMASVVCNVCRSSENPIQMIFCDRRSCTFMAHLECVKLRERPLTFLCESCKGEEVKPPAVDRRIRMAPPACLQGWLKNFQPAAASVTATPAGKREEEEVDDDPLYFLKPSKHCLAAQKELATWRGEHPGADGGAGLSRGGMNANPNRKHPRSVPRCTQRRNADEIQKYLRQSREKEEEDLSDPAQREAMVHRLTIVFARSMMSSLRQKRDIQQSRLQLDFNGDVVVPGQMSSASIAAEEAKLWNEAIEKSRPQAQEKLNERLLKLRQEKEVLLRIKAQREAAALAKLARLIAAHR